MKVFLALGSNMGDRGENIRKAIEAVDALPCTSVDAVSGIMETDAAGNWDTTEERRSFLNCCVRLETTVPPQRLLTMIEEIERKLGREGKGIRLNGKGERIYSDRPIDIDILLYGKRRINTAALQVPHPRMQERDFVMIPLKEIMNK